MWHHKLRKAVLNGTQTLADIGGGTTGLSQLPQALTINSQTVQPTFRYEAKNATLADWSAVVGEDLTADGSGGILGVDAPFLDGTQAIQGQGTKRWQAGDNAFGDVTNADMIWEIVGTNVQPDETPVSTGFLFSKKDLTSASTPGYCAYVTSTGATPVFMVSDGTTRVLVTSPTPVTGQYYHWFVVVRRSGNITIYANGVRGQSLSISGVGSLSNSVPLTMNGSSGVSPVYGKNNWVYCSMWQGVGLLDTDTPDELAAERFARLTGVYLDRYGIAPDFSVMRNASALLEKTGQDGGQVTFPVGAYWPRIGRVKDRYNRYRVAYQTEPSGGLRYTGLPALTNTTIAVDHKTANLTNGDVRLAGLSDGTVNNRMLVRRNNADASVLVDDGGVSQASITDAAAVLDDVWQELRGTFVANDINLYVDAVLGGNDAAATIPTTSQLDIGQGVLGTLQPDAFVRVRLLSKAGLTGVSSFGEIMSKASAYISTPAGVSVGTTDTNVGGTFTAVDLSDFTLSAAGVLTYTGADTKRFYVAGACSGAKSGGGTVGVTTSVEKNGTGIVSSESTRDVTGTSIGAWAVFADVELATNDTINFAVRIAAGTETITMDKLSIVVIEAGN